MRRGGGAVLPRAAGPCLGTGPGGLSHAGPVLAPQKEEGGRGKRGAPFMVRLYSVLLC